MNDRLRPLKIILSWAAVVVGLGVSVFGLGVLGNWQFHLYELPWPWYSLTLFSTFAVIPLAASLCAFHNRKISALLYVAAVPVLFITLRSSELRDANRNLPTEILLPSFAFIMLCYIWAVAHKYGWPEMTFGRAFSPRGKKAMLLGAGILSCALVFLTSIHLAISWERPGDCGYDGTPFVKPYAGDAAFVARIVHVNRIIGAVAIVEDRFWGMSQWTKVVLLKGGRPGQRYFADGRLDGGPLTRWPLPVFDLKCTGSTLIEDAQVELRLLRESPRWEGVRIIGKVMDRRPWRSIAGMNVLITGPSGTTVATTDKDGIYDVSGLPSGHYSVRSDVPPDKNYHEFSHCRENREPAELKAGDVWGCTLLVR